MDLRKNSPKEPIFDELESIVRIKQAEAMMFQARADDARRESEALKRISVTKNERIEEEYTSRISKLRLAEADEMRKQKWMSSRLLNEHISGIFQYENEDGNRYQGPFVKNGSNKKESFHLTNKFSVLGALCIAGNPLGSIPVFLCVININNCRFLHGCFPEDPSSPYPIQHVRRLLFFINQHYTPAGSCATMGR
ncbi:protein OBERON 4 [Sesamum angolense]|uniref:Protein OBERON 4 n=1 Tax=Sesamum angolense TaxID=2727404 RepID=A0AAE1XG10_9LAMI|nr:protein OBERON 4 [Sesamum angolense]